MKKPNCYFWRAPEPKQRGSKKQGTVHTPCTKHHLRGKPPEPPLRLHPQTHPSPPLTLETSLSSFGERQGKRTCCLFLTALCSRAPSKASPESLVWPLIKFYWLQRATGASWVAQWQGICLPMQETSKTRVWTLGWEDPWSRKWQPTPVFLPGKSHGQRTLGATVAGVAESQTQLSNWAETAAGGPRSPPVIGGPGQEGSRELNKGISASCSSPGGRIPRDGPLRVI